MTIDDKDELLIAVKKDGLALKHASDALKNDKEVVLAAVKQEGCALQYASQELKADKEVVLKAVRQTSWTIQYASPGLYYDVCRIGTNYVKALKQLIAEDIGSLAKPL